MAGNQKGRIGDAGKPARFLDLLDIGPERALSPARLDGRVANGAVQGQVGPKGGLNPVVELVLDVAEAQPVSASGFKPDVVDVRVRPDDVVEAR